MGARDVPSCKDALFAKAFQLVFSANLSTISKIIPARIAIQWQDA